MAKIRFGVKNLKYAKLTYTNGLEEYGNYVDIPGAKSISLSPAGETATEYADDTVWFEEASNDGYTGTVNVEELPESFLIDIMGQVKDTKGTLFESANAEIAEFALAGEFTNKGDAVVNGKRFCLFRCKAARPNMDGTGKGNSLTVDTDTLNITVRPRLSDNKVKATANSNETAYATWFNSVVTEVTGTAGTTGTTGTTVG